MSRVYLIEKDLASVDKLLCFNSTGFKALWGEFEEVFGLGMGSTLESYLMRYHRFGISLSREVAQTFRTNFLFGLEVGSVSLNVEDLKILIDGAAKKWREE